MNVLFVSNLYPNDVQPERGVFNREQLVPLSKICNIKVVAPLPWAPGFLKEGERAQFRKVKDFEMIDDLEVYHPRYFVIPKIGRSLYARFFYWGIKKLIEDIHKDFKFDVIFGTWAYPDCVAVERIAKEYKVPFITRVHGSDINIFTQARLRRNMIVNALNSSQRVIANTQDLKEKMIHLGVEKDKILVLSNGVDKKKFYKTNKLRARKELGLREGGRYILFAGNLVQVKNISCLIDAFTHLPEDVHLVIIGDGELRNNLTMQAEKLEVLLRTKFIGKVSHDEMRNWMNAVDVFCLPSVKEGCPNVILEALSCGTPVVGSNVGGIPEILTDEKCGHIFESENVSSLYDQLNDALTTEWDSKHIEKSVAHYSWEENANTINDVLLETLK